MTPHAPTDPGEALLAQLFAALERVGDETVRREMVAAFAANHPELATEVGALLDTARRLVDARPGEPAPQQLAPGQCLGPFVIRRLIAVGGMGEIYEAEEVELHRVVAVKVIRRDRVSSATRDRFVHEQRVLARLHHTHIIPVYASGTEGNLQYFAMPYIEGRTLAEVVGRAARVVRTRRLGAVSQLAAGGEAESDRAEPAQRPRLSREYVRSVADVVAQAADALEHAHRLGVYHQDLKPSNLIVDPLGQCWVIDFGLAAVEGKPARPGGTPAYMAPEQHAGKFGPSCDVWGLGTTLYELLALRPAFAGDDEAKVRDEVLSRDPPPPGAFVRGVPAELQSVCRKALGKDPARRYASPAELAADLRNWLTLRPTRAHGDRFVRPLWLWFRRNWLWTTPLLLAVAAGAALGVSRFHLSEVRATAAEQRQRDAEQRERELRREVLLQKLQHLRLFPRVNGWSGEAWELAREAAAIDPGGVQGQAVATLVGLDARREFFADPDASGVALDAAGRVLIGGWDSVPASLRMPGAPRAEPRGPPGRGPVAFRPDGTPVRLLTPTKDRPSLLYWDVAADRLIRELPLPGPAFPEPEGFALSADGGTAAAVGQDENGRPDRVVVWNLVTGEQLAELHQSATAVGLSPDGKFLATGDEDGGARVWPLPSGEPITLESGCARVRALAFGRSPQQDGPDRPGRGWLLASGHNGGAVAVWDLSTRVLISRCRDVHQDTLVLAFSPDGVLLAAGGRYWPRLFDVRTGRLALVLNNTAQYWQTGLAFNPDGRRLAVAGVALFGSHGGASVHELARGRGILELRGLSAPPGQIRFSAAGGHCAALSHSWEVGVWDVESGRMLCRGAGPQGLYPNDHAALALDATASRVAAAAGKRAKVWNARTGELLREYELPPGLGDALAFHPSGKLLLVRFETADADRYPIGTIAPREQHPRVIRVRELPDHGPPWLLHEFADLPWHVFGVDIAPDGRVAVADGLTGPGPADARLVVLDPLGGKRLWSAALDKVPGVQFHLDPAGESLWYADRADNKGLCVDPRTGIPLDPERRLNMHYGPGGRFAARVRGAAPFGMDAWSHRGTFPPIHLDVDHHDFNPVRFDPTGNRVAWGRQDGGILVADLPEVGRRLATIDLAR